MITGQQLGLDELMIVNPGSFGSKSLFLGADGTLYQVQGLGAEEKPQGLGQFFLGEGGTLYQVQGTDLDGLPGPAESFGEVQAEENTRELNGYFLGADGSLYEVVR